MGSKLGRNVYYINGSLITLKTLMALMGNPVRVVVVEFDECRLPHPNPSERGPCGLPLAPSPPVHHYLPSPYVRMPRKPKGGPRERMSGVVYGEKIIMPEW